MKNIHILPTNKPSRLFIWMGALLKISIEATNQGTNQNIYITNSEEIKEGDWCLDLRDNSVFKIKLSLNEGGCGIIFKIILTTDQDLDGVQDIDDEFLEFIVKNPSCEFVKVSKIYNSYGEIDIFDLVCTPHSFKYEIIIPKEKPKLVKQLCIQCDGTGETTFSGTYNSQRKCDLCNGKGYIDSKDISQMQSDLELIQSLQKPKQETLEEAAENFWLNDNTMADKDRISYVNGFLTCAKWQQEQIGKSEFLQKLRATKSDAEARRLIFEQFKNK